MNRYTPLLLLLAACCSSAVVAQDAARTSESIAAIRRLAEQGKADAQFNLGYKYAHGDGVAENNAKAVKWFRLVRARL